MCILNKKWHKSTIYETAIQSNKSPPFILFKSIFTAWEPPTWPRKKFASVFFLNIYNLINHNFSYAYTIFSLQGCLNRDNSVGKQFKKKTRQTFIPNISLDGINYIPPSFDETQGTYYS